jgi:hypothetical protein
VENILNKIEGVVYYSVTQSAGKQQPVMRASYDNGDPRASVAVWQIRRVVWLRGGVLKGQINNALARGRRRVK